MRQEAAAPGPRVSLFCLRLIILSGALTAAIVPANAATGQFVANNTPRFVKTAPNLGAADSAEIIDVSLWLKIPNREILDSLVRELYDPASPDYRAWLKAADIAARFAPSAEDVRTVEHFLTSHNLTIVRVGPDNFYVRARGSVAAVQKAFQIRINTYEVNGKTYRANASNPYVEAPAAALVAAVYGLDDQEYEHPLLSVTALTSRHASVANAAAATAADAALFISHCFTGTHTEQYSNGGTLPIATYTGNTYNFSQYAPGCGYTPPEIHTAYQLNGLYAEGYRGEGETIVIIDWCGSPTIRSDANTFSATFGLPALTSSNFQILNSSTAPTCAAPDPEINIDVEWAHAIAPDAHIALVVPPSAGFMDVDDAELYALAHNLGGVISGSYGAEELYVPAAVLNEENLLNELAAGMGISANFATGDYGDYTFDAPTLNPPSVSAPADSPYATAVGGVTLALTSNNTIAWQTGWGNNETLLNDAGTIFDPPFNLGLFGGSGGGPSAVFSKPSFQSSLPGRFRELPDIAWLADPFTGAAIAISYPFQSPALVWEVYGGTSLATPMFSALWAIANQEARTRLGQAAAYLYKMPKSAITDVVAINSSTNVTASIQQPFATDTYNAATIAAPLGNTTRFYSALWSVPLEEDTVYVLTFGTDTGLVTKPGWDNVTGLGTPRGQAFADHFK
jgi:subtilase family serine protease